MLTVDFEDEADIGSFLKFVKYHSARLKCPQKDVFLRLAREWEVQMSGEEKPKSKKKTGP